MWGSSQGVERKVHFCKLSRLIFLKITGMFNISHSWSLLHMQLKSIKLMFIVPSNSEVHDGKNWSECSLYRCHICNQHRTHQTGFPTASESGVAASHSSRQRPCAPDGASPPVPSPHVLSRPPKVPAPHRSRNAPQTAQILLSQQQPSRHHFKDGTNSPTFSRINCLTFAGKFLASIYAL